MRILAVTPETDGEETKPVVLPAPPQSQTEPETQKEAERAEPIEQIEPVIKATGAGGELKALFDYMTSTEVHTYAFSVAANVILSLFPFIVLMLTLAQRVFHSPAMVVVLGDFIHTMLPSNQDFVWNSMKVLAHTHQSTKIFSVIMLLVTSTGVFLPLEVALNKVWGVKKNRNYLANQAVSLGLAIGVGVLVMASVAFTASQKSVLTWIFFGHTNNIFFTIAAGGLLKFCAVIASIMLFFLIYWVLPNRKVPAMAVLPTAVVVGLFWEFAKYLYVLALPRLDFEAVYGPFRVSVGLMMWAFISGLLLLGGAHFSATRCSLRIARAAERE